MIMGKGLEGSVVKYFKVLSLLSVERLRKITMSLAPS
jgi:hypothetical protein